MSAASTAVDWHRFMRLQFQQHSRYQWYPRDRTHPSHERAQRANQGDRGHADASVPSALLGGGGMTDRYQSLAHNPIGKFIVKNLGLPNPPVLERWSEGA